MRSAVATDYVINVEYISKATRGRQRERERESVTESEREREN